MSTRFYGYIGRGPSPGGFWHLEVLPRARLSIDKSIGIGFAWIASWLHVWLWDTRTDRPFRQIELLPRIWLHYHKKHGAGVHLQWWRWKAHFWFWRTPENKS